MVTINPPTNKAEWKVSGFAMANYCNSQDDLSCIIRKFGKIILLFFSLYEAHIPNLQGAPSLVKCNLGRGQGSVVRSTDYADYTD